MAVTEGDLSKPCKLLLGADEPCLDPAEMESKLRALHPAGPSCLEVLTDRPMGMHDFDARTVEAAVLSFPALVVVPLD